jgi:hypothetical protein
MILRYIFFLTLISLNPLHVKQISLKGFATSESVYTEGKFKTFPLRCLFIQEGQIFLRILYN